MRDPSVTALDEQTRRAVGTVLGRIPSGRFLMTACDEDHTRVVLVEWVQQVSAEPAMVLVALEKGQPIVPLLHASHGFALNQIGGDDRLTLRKFSRPATDDDPLQSLDTFRSVTGSPILNRAQAYLDCELVRHLDIEGDHDLYVGLVRDGGVLAGGDVDIRLG